MKLPVNYDKLDRKGRKAVREEYIRLQGGKCYYCRAPLMGKPKEIIRKKPITKRFFPEGFFDYPVHLHHSHDTGLTLGAVHCHCNAVLWQYHGE